jgi:hypothetical protein
LLFIIPLIITVFAPIRTFSGPLRYAYLEYATKISSLALSLLNAVVTNFHSIPTLALPALFFLPVLPIFFFVFFPALPVVWHFIAYHYRRRLNAITASVAKTNASLDLALTRALQAVALAHTYEKQLLCTVSTTRNTPSLALSRHSTDFGTPKWEEEEWQLTQTPGTLGATLAGHVLDTEDQMAIIQDASKEVRALSEQAVAVATEGDMVAGKTLEEKAAHSLEEIVTHVEELQSMANQARATWIEFRRCLNKITSSASTITASLEVAVTQARRDADLTQTYEKQALEFISTTRRTAFETVMQSPGILGADLAKKVLAAEKQRAIIEDASQGVHVLLEQAITVATEGDIATGEKLEEKAAHSLKNILKQVAGLHSIADQAKETWVEFRRLLNKITSSASATTASLELAITRAQRDATLAHTYEKQALEFVSITRHASQTLIQSPGILGTDLAKKLLGAEKQMAVIEGASKGVRVLSEQAITAATDGDIVAGEESAQNAANSLKDLLKEVDELHSIVDQARRTWIEFRRRLNKITLFASSTTASLELAVTQARQDATRAHTYEKQALEFVSPTRHASQTLIQSPGILGTELAKRVLDAEKQMALIEDTSQQVRALSEQAITVATEGDIVAGEELVKSATNTLADVRKEVDKLRTIVDQANRTWVDFRRRLNQITSSTSKTTANLEVAITQARRAATLAHSYEKQALEFVSTTRRTAFETIALHNADVFGRSGPVVQARQTISSEAERVRALGSSLTDKMSLVEAKVREVESEAENIRALLEEVVTATVDGDVATGENLAGRAAESLKAVVRRMQGLCSTSDEVRQIWVTLSVKYSAI